MGDREDYLRAISEAPSQGLLVIGADECGTGSWAGPLYVCACAASTTWISPVGLDDSKRLNATRREALFFSLRKDPRLHFEFATAEVEEIDQEGLGVATKRCFLQVLKKLTSAFPRALVVVDGEVQLPGLDYLHFPRADSLVPSVMAASVYGKVLRDRAMVEVGQKYPGYSLGDHAGYGTPQHEEALRKKGLSPAHRKYTPMERILSGKRGRS